MPTFNPTDPFLLNPAFQGRVNEAQYQALVDDVLRGDRPLDDLLDFMSDSRIDPDQWLNAQVDELDYVVDSGVRFSRDETGLFLPFTK